MKRLLMLAVSGLFPILGLFSCSQDKPQDSWALTEPVIRSEAAFETPISLASAQRLPGDSELVFRESETAAGRLSVESNCRSASGQVRGRQEIQSPTRIKIKNFWPREMWINLSHEQLKNSSCDFSFSLMNHNGSSHVFSLTGAKLADFLNGARPISDIEIGNEDSGDMIEDRLFEFADTTSGTQFHLSCENFDNSKTLKPVRDQATSSLSELVLGPLTSRRGAELTSLDPRLIRTSQKCRLLRFSMSQPGQGTDIKMSPDFRVKFPRPKLAVKLTSDIRHADGLPTPGQTQPRADFSLFKISLTNTADVATAVVIPSDIGPARVQLLGRASAFPELHPQTSGLVKGSMIRNEPFRFVVTGAKRTWQKGSSTIIEINPGETVSIDGQLNTQCFMLTVWKAPGLPAPLNDPRNSLEAGLFFDFEKSFELRQFSEWNVENPDLASDLAFIPTISLKPRTENPPENFQGLDSYYLLEDPNGAAPLSDLKQLPQRAPYWNLINCFYAENGPNRL